jgi:hypothetical protein
MVFMAGSSKWWDTPPGRVARLSVDDGSDRSCRGRE